MLLLSSLWLVGAGPSLALAPELLLDPWQGEASWTFEETGDLSKGPRVTCNLQWSSRDRTLGPGSVLSSSTAKEDRGASRGAGVGVEAVGSFLTIASAFP
jgi:hypothetical protein